MQTARSVAGRWLVKEGGAAPGVEQHSAVPGLVQRRISRVAQQGACAPDQRVAGALALHHGAFGQVAEVDGQPERAGVAVSRDREGSWLVWACLEIPRPRPGEEQEPLFQRVRQGFAGALMNQDSREMQCVSRDAVAAPFLLNEALDGCFPSCMAEVSGDPETAL